MMVWLKMGGGGKGGAENGDGQSQQLWHSLAGEGALDNLSLASLGEPALLCLVSEEKNKNKLCQGPQKPVGEDVLWPGV